MLKGFRKCCGEMLAWLDGDNAIKDPRCARTGLPQTELDRWLPFAFLHLGCVLAIFAGTSAIALASAFILYCVRMFAITAFYHRYFSHRTFKTSRLAQAIFAILGLASVQKGPLWWAAHHRAHHQFADTEKDIHSPITRSFVWSHIGWITSSVNIPTDYSRVRDFDQYPELRWLNRYDWFIPLVLFVSLWQLGETLPPSFHTSGAQMVAWGFFISTTVLFHATASINSLSHKLGFRSFNTEDNSKNNFVLALITFGEGWHNNHHRFSYSVRQGFLWWQIDLSYYILSILAALGIIWELKPVPASVYAELARKGLNNGNAIEGSSS